MAVFGTSSGSTSGSEPRGTACIAAFSGRPDKFSHAAQTVCLVRSIATWEVTTALTTTLTTVGHPPANSYKAANLASRPLAVPARAYGSEG